MIEHDRYVYLAWGANCFIWGYALTTLGQKSLTPFNRTLIYFNLLQISLFQSEIGDVNSGWIG